MRRQLPPAVAKPRAPAPKQHADYIPSNLYHTNYIQTDAANRGPHIPLSDVPRSVKFDVRINGVARIRHCVGHPASRRLLAPSQTVLQFLLAEPTRLQRAADGVRRPTFQWNPPQPATSCTAFCRRLLPSPRTTTCDPADRRPRTLVEVTVPH